MSYTSDATQQKVSAESLVANSLATADKIQQFGAFIHIDGQTAIAKARIADAQSVEGKDVGPLHGIPIVVKDNIHVAGMPNSAGTLALKNFFPEENNAVVSLLEEAGAIVIGKTNMHELAFGITSNNATFGPVRNAFDKSLIAGGSSGGTAVAVASNVVTMGLGTDTGGSSRIPAVLNGVVGLRPTLGRYTSTHVTPVASTRDTIGPIADSVASIALMDSVITGETNAIHPAQLSKLRLGVPRNYFYEGLSEDVKTNIETVLEKLRQAGVQLIDVELPNLQSLNEGVSFPVALHEFVSELPAYLKEFDTGIEFAELVDQITSPDVKAAAEAQLSAEAIPLEIYELAINEFRPKLISTYNDAFASYTVDAFIVPATPCVAQSIDDSDETVLLNGEQVPTFATYIRNTDPSSNAGLPSLAMPSGTSKQGLPIGILLDGPENSDRRIIEIGLAIEALLSQK